jgi:signal transduction histidine kinase
MQEALQNVSAHAQAQRVQVTLDFSAEAVTLAISDNGQGFDVEAVRRNNTGHFGIMGMQERVESLGGQLTILTGPGQGTQIKVSAPIPAASLSFLAPSGDPSTPLRAGARPPSALPDGAPVGAQLPIAAG